MPFRRISVLLLAAATLLLAGHFAAAEVIVAYQATNADSNAYHLKDVTVTGNPLVAYKATGVAGIGLTRVLGNTGFVWQGWTGVDLVNDLEHAKQANDYFEWGFHANTGQWNLSSLDISYYRDGGGPADLSFQVKINDASDFTEFYSDSFAQLDSGVAKTRHITTGINGYTHVTDAVFRIYGYHATADSGPFRVRDHADFETAILTINDADHAIVLRGTPVPEPSTLALLAVFFAMWAVLRRYG